MNTEHTLASGKADAERTIPDTYRWTVTPSCSATAALVAVAGLLAAVLFPAMLLVIRQRPTAVPTQPAAGMRKHRAARSPRRNPERVASVLLAAVLVAAVPLVIAATGASTTAPATVTGEAGPGLLGLSPQDQLLLLAQQVRPTAGDALVGDDSCVRIQRRVDSGDSMIVFESARRITPAGAGIIAQRNATVLVGADSAEVDRQLHLAAVTVTAYGSGELLSPVGDPVSADAAVLAARVADRTGADRGAAAVVAVLTDLTTIRYLDVAQRAAVLRVLATLPSLTSGRLLVDPAERTGVTFHLDDGTNTIVFSVDPSSGRLLTAEVVAGGHRYRTLLLGSSRCGCPPTAASTDPGAAFWPPVLRTEPLPAGRCSAPLGAPTFQAVDRAPRNRP